MLKEMQGGVCAPKGFTASGVHAGIRKNKTKKDLALIYSEVPAAAVEWENVGSSGCDWKCSIAPEWQADAPFFTMQTGNAEVKDMRLEPADWYKNDQPQWGNAIDCSGKITKKVYPRDVPELEKIQLRPVAVTSAGRLPDDTPLAFEGIVDFLMSEPWDMPKDGQFKQSGANSWLIEPENGRGFGAVFDFGNEMSGFLKLDIESQEDGVIVDVVYGEEMYNDRLQCRFRNKAYRMVDRYILRKGINHLGNLVAERGGKLIQLTFRNYSKTLGICKFEFEYNRYPFGNPSSFFCSDEKLNGIWNMCVETMRACATDIFVDCPWRERAFWINDLIVENRTSLAAFGASDIHKRAFRLAFSQQQEDGLVPALCPIPDGVNVHLPATSLLVVQMLYDYYLASNDAETVKTYLGQVEKIFDIFESSLDERGSISAPANYWNFYDWGFELTNISFDGCRESMINSLYVIALKDFLYLADSVGVEVPAKAEYLKRIDRTAKAIFDCFENKETGLLEDIGKRDDIFSPGRFDKAPVAVSSHLAHAFALLSGVVPADKVARFTEALTDPALVEPELYMSGYVFRALQEQGDPAAALERIRKYWGRCVETGFPTLYEGAVVFFGRESMGRAGSLCHGFGTIPLEFFQTAILGVTAAAPGFTEFTFAPQLFDLEFASGRIPTPNGAIQVKLEKKNGKIAAELIVPGGCTALIDGGQRRAEGRYLLEFQA